MPSTDESETHRNDDQLHAILRVAVDAATAAGKLIRSAVLDPNRPVEELKGRNDLVTEIDRQSQRIIEGMIRSAFPAHEIIGEETYTGVVIQAGSGFRWIVDPIDGTTNFVHRLPPYAVSIGVMYDDSFVASAVLNVPADELFTARLGGGAFLNGKPIRVSSELDLGAALIATGFPERTFDELERVLSIQGAVMRRCRGVRRAGAASVDLANIACGRLDGFYEQGLQSWDIAAGVLLVNEAGGKVTNTNGTAELFESRSIVATNGSIHDELLACTKIVNQRN